MKKIICAIVSALMIILPVIPVCAEDAALNENPLTGLMDLPVEAVGKRPVAVMINNHPDNYPQYNISRADVLFEVVVEHDLTRMLGLFADYTNVPYLVSVRSYRYYFPQISQGFDAYYIHWGEDTTMMGYYEELGLDSYDGLSNDYIFGRDQERLDNGYSLEHTACLYGDRIPAQLEQDGVRTDIKEELSGPAFNFVPEGAVRTPDGEDCNFVYVDYGNQTTQFTYNSEEHVYEKYALEEPQIDGISGEQMSFENVFILYTAIEDREDDEAGRKWLDVYGGVDEWYAVGYYLTEGKAEQIRWEKIDTGERLKFYNMDGKEIKINRGKTYITYTYMDSATLSSDIPEEYR